MARTKTLMMAFGFGSLAFLTGPTWAQGPTVSIHPEYLMTLEAPLDPTAQAMGTRFVVNIPAGGTVRGPKISGTVIAPAGDWLHVMADGSLRLDARDTIKTDDGQLILIETGGVIVPSKAVMDRFNKGEVITSKDEYFVTEARFTTASKKYAWLNHIQAVGKMVTVQKTKIVVDLFAIH